jgi:hypothetical protein
MNIHLNPHSKQLLKEQLAQGGFRSPDEVIERALEALAERESVIPASSPHGMSPAQAVADILELRKGVKLGGLKIKDLIHEGHRI